MPLVTRVPMRCIYCLEAISSTLDHVPPKTIFSPPRPSNLITVPACAACNSSSSLDDQYFGTVLGLRQGKAHQAARKHLFERMLRNIRRPEATGFSELVDRMFVAADKLDPKPVIPDGTVGFLADGARLRRTAARIVRALHYKALDEPLPASRIQRVLFSEELRTEDVQKLIDHLGDAPTTELAGGQFWYAYVEHPAIPDAYLWLLDFHESLAFFVMIDPPPRAVYPAHPG